MNARQRKKRARPYLLVRGRFVQVSWPRFARDFGPGTSVESMCRAVVEDAKARGLFAVHVV